MTYSHDCTDDECTDETPVRPAAYSDGLRRGNHQAVNAVVELLKSRPDPASQWVLGEFLRRSSESRTGGLPPATPAAYIDGLERGYRRYELILNDLASQPPSGPSVEKLRGKPVQPAVAAAKAIFTHTRDLDTKLVSEVPAAADLLHAGVTQCPECGAGLSIEAHTSIVINTQGSRVTRVSVRAGHPEVTRDPFEVLCANGCGWMMPYWDQLSIDRTFHAAASLDHWPAEWDFEG